ncbi:hypothetical protein B0A48_08717 [Cryoendolithus antarcticus]|uniref:DUF7053 domain-containing protein n=1 Tax=Cryoendolithus antarcticus TaxID=1507870 RepID=A0A1V8T478_9PEZI|nr:hypothetical protein B0A48_08717 [Cryoendolithus antarcticus]
MSRRSHFTTITPVPRGVTRSAAVDWLHDHRELIRLNPLVLRFDQSTPPATAPPDEQECTWYEITDQINYGLVKSEVTYKACFNDLPNGVQTHVYAPAGLDIRERWTVGGNEAGEPREILELGVDAPRDGLYVREDVQMRCNVFLSRYVKRNLNKAHKVVIQRVGALAETTEESGANPETMTPTHPKRDDWSPAVDDKDLPRLPRNSGLTAAWHHIEIPAMDDLTPVEAKAPPITAGPSSTSGAFVVPRKPISPRSPLGLRTTSDAFLRRTNQLTSSIHTTSNAMMASLVALPIELVERVVTSLETEETGILRLVCHELCDKASRGTYLKLFTDRSVDVTQDGLNALKEALAGDGLPRQLRNLTLVAVVYHPRMERMRSPATSPDAWSPAAQTMLHRGDCPGKFKQSHSDRRFAARREVAELRLQQARHQYNVETGVYVELLALAFESIKSTCSKDGLASLVLSVAVQTSKRLRFVPDAMDLRAAASEDCKFDEDDDEHCGYESSLASFMANFTSLKTLDLHEYQTEWSSGDAEDGSTLMFDHLSERVQLPVLNELTLRGNNTTEESLLRFLSKLPDLQRLEMTHVNLSEGIWMPTFDYVKDKTKVQYLELTDLFQGKHGESLNGQGIGPGGGGGGNNNNPFGPPGMPPPPPPPPPGMFSHSYTPYSHGSYSNPQQTETYVNSLLSFRASSVPKNECKIDGCFGSNHVLLKGMWVSKAVLSYSTFSHSSLKAKVESRWDRERMREYGPGNNDVIIMD